MTILALDCSFTGLALALQNGAHTHVFGTSTPRSSDVLPTEIAELFVKSATSAAALSRILVTTGPGSFTGIRLGLATAEAFKLIYPHIEIIGLSTLHALARQVVATHHPEQPFTLMLDAAGGQTYQQTFSATGNPLSPAVCEPLNPSPSTLHPTFFQSSLMLASPAVALEALDASHLFTLAEDPTNHLPATPVYLKPLTYKQVS